MFISHLHLTSGEKLAEALSPLLPGRLAREALAEAYDGVYERAYMAIMRRKLGLLSIQDDDRDLDLVEDLLGVMQTTGSDFTATFRCLSGFPMPPFIPPGHPPPDPLASASASDPTAAPGLSDTTSEGVIDDGGILETLLSARADKVRWKWDHLLSSPSFTPYFPALLSKG